MILFRVLTHFQLLCSIQVKEQLLPNEKADLHIFNSSTNFSGIIDELKKLKIFEDIVICDDFNKIGDILNNSPQKAKNEFKNPLKIYKELNFEIKNYTDVYFGHDMIPNKLFYYAMVCKNYSPKIHLLDEGLNAYVKPLKQAVKTDRIPHSRFGRKNYIDNICELLLYEPRIYRADMPHDIITRIPDLTEKTKEIFLKLYNPPPLAAEKNIYLTAAISMGKQSDKISSSELQMIDSISEYFDKNDLIIKAHPRAKNSDALVYRGYKLMGSCSNIPWEIVTLCDQISDRTLISFASTGSLTPFYFSRKNTFAIFLNRYKDFCCYPTGTAEWQEFMLSASSIYNKDRKQIFFPRDEEELKEIIKYINCQKRIMNNNE